MQRPSVSWWRSAGSRLTVPGTRSPSNPVRGLVARSRDGRVDTIPAGDLAQFLNLIKSLMFWAALVTDTPVSRFITTKQISSEGSQKQGDNALLTKTRNRAGELGNAWEDCLRIAMRLENTYGRGGLDEQVMLTALWEPLESRDETAELERAALRKELGMPIQLIGRELGLTQEDIAAWQEDAEQRATVAVAAFGQQGDEETQGRIADAA